MITRKNKHSHFILLHDNGDLFTCLMSCFVISLCAARERILSNLQKHPVPRPAPELQQQKAPVAEVPATCLTDSKAAAELVQQDLRILQDQARYLESIQRLISTSSVAHTKKNIF